MSLDHSAIWTRIQDLVASDMATGDCMHEVIRVARVGRPHSDWDRFASLVYDADVASLGPWIPRTFAGRPAPFLVKGLVACLCNPSDSQRHVWADMYAGVVADYDAADEEDLAWVFYPSASHYPDTMYAGSSCLRHIYEIGNASPDGLGIDAEWPLGLAFAAFSVRRVLGTLSPACLGNTAATIGVAVGFDSGDMLKIGAWSQVGFVPVKRPG